MNCARPCEREPVSETESRKPGGQNFARLFSIAGAATALRQRNTARLTGRGVAICRITNRSRWLGAESPTPETVPSGNRRQVERLGWCSFASGKSKYVAVFFPAGQAAGDQHRLMFIRLTPSKAIQIGKSTGVADGGVGALVGVFSS